ncbi:PREDICTED: protein SUPPRESSOR OF npr1-1, CONSTITUTIVE 1-like [Fragaria vesca subsp. vesca]
MALSTQRASSSSHALAEPPPRWKFDVFLSFRGQDTRWGFISHLYHQLEFCQLFKTFIDDRELEIGSEISPELLSDIEHSHLAIVVISPNYASSTWCLDELAKIIESMNPRDKRILPVFLNVDPSDVRHQRNSFAEAFAKHEVKFSDDPKKVESWRHALRKVANLSGWDAKNYKCERELTDVIVKSVWEKLRPTITLSNSEEKLVGMDFRLGQMGLLLTLEEKDVRFIGIWGMGGVGKTTLAKLVYERIFHDFEVAKFLDVRKSHGQLVNLQKQVLFPVLKENVSQVFNDYEGTIFIKRCMRNKKVLLVVDDVDSCDHLKLLVGDKSWFGEGSRIIVTTRDQRLLTEHHIETSFKLSGLNDCEALELFCQNAFKKELPEEGFSELSKCFIDYVEGLPLALKIGTEAIKGIRLSLSELEEADSNWNFECFSKMLKLMFLEFDNLIVSSGPKFLPNSLIILRWSWYPSKSLPACFRPNLLAELEMSNSQLVELWDGRLDLPKLKCMDLNVSKYLKKTPDFTELPK